MLRSLTNDAAAETEAVRASSEPWQLGGLGSRGSGPGLLPEEDGTSMGWQAAEGGGKAPLRTGADAGLVRLQWTGTGGGELPADGADTVLRSNRSATDMDSSPGLRRQATGRGMQAVNVKQSDNRNIAMQTKPQGKHLHAHAKNWLCF